ncbi:hypothetical protein LAUMK13_02836 [Mycobacterium innocens]|uniref:Uncharacterized protein n=1 Tax=Mycobacterium innocens TaxID=2341083 RepID=A0A498Q3L3_9MYCO|nr:hypothetical protein LAUMK13_02836 [Mycobacterium innocens]
MKALPITPGPGDSNLPRAKTTSTCGQFAALARRGAPGAPGGDTAAAIVSAAQTATATNNCSTDFTASGARTRRW